MCWRTLSKNENNVSTWSPEHMDTCLFSQEASNAMPAVRFREP